LLTVNKATCKISMMNWEVNSLKFQYKNLSLILRRLEGQKRWQTSSKYEMSNIRMADIYIY